MEAREEGEGSRSWNKLVVPTFEWLFPQQNHQMSLDEDSSVRAHHRESYPEPNVKTNFPGGFKEIILWECSFQLRNAIQIKFILALRVGITISSRDFYVLLLIMPLGIFSEYEVHRGKYVRC